MKEQTFQEYCDRVRKLEKRVKALEQEPYICDTCKHNDKEWDEEPCDGCCGNHSGYEPSGDLISRQATLAEFKRLYYDDKTVTRCAELVINGMPPVNPQEPKIGCCKDCKYFEYDSVAKVNGIPLIVAHEICNKWGDGCKTKEDGYCFLYEPQERSE